MSGFIKAKQLLELMTMMQNTHNGISLNDIQNHFECSKRTAQRMKATIEERFFFNFEEVKNSDSLIKRWRLKKTTSDKMMIFSEKEIKLLQELSNLLEDDEKKIILTNLIKKLKTVTFIQ